MRYLLLTLSLIAASGCADSPVAPSDGLLTLQVVTPNGVGIAGASVTVTDDGRELATLTTSAAGWVTFQPVPLHRVIVLRLRASGFADIDQPLRLTNPFTSTAYSMAPIS